MRMRSLGGFCLCLMCLMNTFIPAVTILVGNFFYGIAMGSISYPHNVICVWDRHQHALGGIVLLQILLDKKAHNDNKYSKGVHRIRSVECVVDSCGVLFVNGLHHRAWSPMRKQINAKRQIVPRIREIISGIDSTRQAQCKQQRVTKRNQHIGRMRQKDWNLWKLTPELLLYWSNQSITVYCYLYCK